MPDEPKLSPLYKAAESDSVLIVRMIGNTADVGSLQANAITAGQLIAIGDFLASKGRQMIAMQEALEAERQRRMGIVTPGDTGVPLAVGKFKASGQ